MNETVPQKPRAPMPWLQFLVITGGVIMAFMDPSIVNVALPRLMTAFGAGVNSIQWVTTAYLLTAGAAIPATGYLGTMV